MEGLNHPHPEVPPAKFITPAPVYFIRHRYEHHASPTAFDNVTAYLGDVIEPSPRLSRLGETVLRVPAKLTSWWCGSFEYSRHDAIRELAAALHMRRHNDSIYHFLFGEKSFLYSGRLNGRNGNRLIGTFHHPASHYRWLFRSTTHLRHLALATCVSTNQIEFLEKLVGAGKVRFVPLGIDSDYFHPAETPSDGRPYCVFSGRHLRDFETLGQVIEGVLARHSEVEFHLVTLRKYCGSIPKNDRVQIHEGIPDAAYLRLLQHARLLLLPLLESTFVSATLESMACGLPLVTNRGGVSDYVSDQCAIQLATGDVQGMTEAVLELLQNEGKRETMAQASRARAMQFAWPIVAARLLTLYKNIP